MTKLNPQSDHPDQMVPSSQSASDQPLDAAAEPGPNAGQANGASLLPSEEIDLLQRERDELKDQVLRIQADFANYQKRAGSRPMRFEPTQSVAWRRTCWAPSTTSSAPSKPWRIG